MEQVRGGGARGGVLGAGASWTRPRLADLAALDDAGFRQAVQRLADQADRAQPLRAQRRLRDRQLGRRRACCRRRGGWRRDADPAVRDAGAWAVDAAQLRRWRLARAAAASGVVGMRARSARARASAAPSRSPVSARAAAASNSASGRAGSSGERALGLGERRLRVALVAERRGEQGAGERVAGLGGDERRRARRCARRPVGRRRRRRGRASRRRGGVGRRRARRPRRARRGRGRGGRRRATGRRASARIDGAQRRRRSPGSGSAPRAVEELRGGGVRAHRRQRLGLAEPRRRRRRRGAVQTAAASRAAAGSAATAAAQSSAERISAAAGVASDDGKEEPSHGGPDLGRGGAMTAPVFLTLGHGYSAARARRNPAAAGGVLGTTRSAERAAAMRRPASSRSTGPTPPRWTAAIAARGRASWCRCRRTRTGDPVLARHEAALGGGAAVRGSAISRPPGSTATGRAAGSTRRARSSRSTTAGAGGGRGGARLARDRAAGASVPAGRASTGRAAAPSTGCARGGRSGW